MDINVDETLCNHDDHDVPLMCPAEPGSQEEDQDLPSCTKDSAGMDRFVYLTRHQ